MKIKGRKMKKRIGVAILACLCVFAMIYKLNMEKESTEKKEKEVKIEPMGISEKVDSILKMLSLDEKIGQMLFISSSNTTMTERLKELLENSHVGGFILFKENFTSYENTKKLIEDIQKINQIPMFIGIDQEGGKVQRFSSLEDASVTKIPSMRIIGDTNDEKLAYETGVLIAEELKTLGINLDFAPVADVLSNADNQIIGDRSFGTDANLVSKMAISMASGLRQTGVIPVYKHFPGHGNTKADSHYELPVIVKGKEQLKKEDLIPFENAIANGAEIIMIGHLAVPNITGTNTPASLSKEIITDLLKNEMNYHGLVITDALNMKAITNQYEEKEIYELAINAGVDLLLMPKDSLETINLIKESIKENKITEEQIDNSVRKILTLKYTKLSNYVLGKEYLNSEKHQKLIEKITKKK